MLTEFLKKFADPENDLFGLEYFRGQASLVTLHCGPVAYTISFSTCMHRLLLWPYDNCFVAVICFSLYFETSYLVLRFNYAELKHAE